MKGIVFLGNEVKVHVREEMKEERGPFDSLSNAARGMETRA